MARVGYSIWQRTYELEFERIWRKGRAPHFFCEASGPIRRKIPLPVSTCAASSGPRGFHNTGPLASPRPPRIKRSHRLFYRVEPNSQPSQLGLPRDIRASRAEASARTAVEGFAHRHALKVTVPPEPQKTIMVIQLAGGRA
jgi:hypothetical protein